MRNKNSVTASQRGGQFNLIPVLRAFPIQTFKTKLDRQDPQEIQNKKNKTGSSRNKKIIKDKLKWS